MSGCMDKVLEFFDGDMLKSGEWFNTSNPHLGNLTPIHYASLKGCDKLEEWIDNQLEGNSP